jgi:hypothetical protein
LKLRLDALHFGGESGNRGENGFVRVGLIAGRVKVGCENVNVGSYSTHKAGR